MSLLWLKNVPWATILANAPGLVDGAKKLAVAMRNKPDTADIAAPEQTGDAPARLLAVEEQQRATAELLRSLAEQNAQTVEALAALRQRTKLQFRITLIALIAACTALLWSI